MFKILDVDLLEQIYEGATVRLAPKDEESATITFNTGVAQGSITDVERNQGTICVTFLDFENYFITIFLPALFLLLRKFGMNENDVQALETYYEHSHMRVIHADGKKSAKIPLHRGLRQDCHIRGSYGECDAPMARFQRRRPVTR